MKNNSSQQAALDAALSNVAQAAPLDYGSPGGSLRPGTLYAYNAALSNESRLTEAHYQQPLVDYVAGHSDSQGSRELLDRLFPRVDVGRRFEYKKQPNSEAMLSEDDDIRTIGSDFKRIEVKGESVVAKTYNKGLMIRLDKDNYPIGSATTNERIAAKLMERLYLNDLRRGLAALLAIDGTGTAKTWNSSAVPDGDVASLIASTGDGSGTDPNVIVYGRGAWLLRYSALLAQSTAGGFAGAMMTPEQLAGILGVDSAVVVKQRYATAKTATSKTRVLNNYVIATYIEPSPMVDDPSSVKRFTSPVDQGGDLAVHVIDTPKFVDIIVEHYSYLVATVSEGTKRLNIS